MQKFEAFSESLVNEHFLPMKSSKYVTLILKSLYCYLVEEEGSDDVFLKFKNKKIWPQHKKCLPISMDTTTPLDVVIEGLRMGDRATVELWDWDLLSPNDHLGSFHMVLDGAIGESFSTDLTLNLKETQKAKYTLSWELA